MTEELKSIWSYDESQALTGTQVAEAILELVQEAKYEGGTVMSITKDAGKKIEEFVDIEAFLASFQENGYAPVRKILKAERGAAIQESDL